MNKARDIDRALQYCLYLIIEEQYTIDQVLALYPEKAKDLRLQLEAVLWLQGKGETLEPRTGFVAASQQRIVRRIKQEQLTTRSRASDKKPLWRMYSFRNIWQLSAALLAIILLLVVGSLSMLAAEKAVPGQALYPLKLFIEQAQISFPHTENKITQLRIEYVLRRQNEIEVLIKQGRFDLLPEIIQNYQNQISLAIQALDRLADSDPASALNLAMTLQEALARQLVSMEILAKEIPLQYRSQLDQVVQIAMNSSTVVEYILATKIWPSLGITTPTATPTPTLVGTNSFPSPTATPTLTLTPSPSITPRVTTVTPTRETAILPSSTPTLKSTTIGGGEGNPKIKTPTPSNTPNLPSPTLQKSLPPTQSSTPTSKPQVTPSPTPTKPGPTRTPRPYP